MRTTSFVALAVAAVIGVTGCGGGDDDSGGTTTSSSSSSSSLGGVKAGDTVDGAVLATRMTDAMVKAGSGAISMDLGSGKATGSFVMKGGKMDQQMTLPIEGQTMEIISTGGVIYMKGLPGSPKPWVKIDPNADDPFSKMFAGMVGDMGDPRQLSEALKGTKATVVSSSAEGTTYDVTIDPSKLVGSGATAAPSAGPVTARYTLDAKDLPTKLTAKVAGQEITITFGDWGKPVTITAPPADQVGAFEIPTS